MKVIDLSYYIDEDTPVFPGDTSPRLLQTKALEKDYYNAVVIEMGMHIGTHVDAPIHLLQEGDWIGRLPIEQFVGNGFLWDCMGQEKIEMRPSYENLVQTGDIVLFYTGFHQFFYEDQERYFNAHPEITHEVIDFLAAKKVGLIGMDMPSPDRMPFPVHKYALSKGMCIIENMVNLEKLAGVKKFDLHAVPLKIGAEGSLVRAYAVVRD